MTVSTAYMQSQYPFVGIGCVVDRDNYGNAVVSELIQGGPAALSGQINAGDIITSIDGQAVASIRPDNLPNWMLGESGTMISLGIKSFNSSHSRIVKLIRQPIQESGRSFASFNQNLVGIGAVLASDIYGNLVVARLLYGGAAAYCKPNDLFGEDKLKKNDIVVAIDGRDVRGLQPIDVRPMLLGPVGTNVTLLIKRAKYEQAVEIVLRRRPQVMQTEVVPVIANQETLRKSVANIPHSPPRKAQAVVPKEPPRNIHPFPQQAVGAPVPDQQFQVMQEVPRMEAFEDQRGKMVKVGVGLVLRERADGSHTVKRLKPGQAAAHCGQIEPGDLLTHVDSLDIAKGAPSSLLADLIAGPQGSVVNLTFEKPDGSRISINLLRGSADYIAEVLRREASNNGSVNQSPRLDSGRQGMEDILAGAVGVSLSLDEDYDTLVTSPERLQSFNIEFKSDVANSLTVHPRRIQLVGLQRSQGIIVDLNILVDDEDQRTPQHLAAELAAQVADAKSPLRNASSTGLVRRADVHVGPVSPPPNAAVVSSPIVSQSNMKGVGLVLRENENRQQVVRRLLPDQAAAQSGMIRAGDVLTHVNGILVQDVPVSSLILGPEGTTVFLRFVRPEEDGITYDVELMRGTPPHMNGESSTMESVNGLRKAMAQKEARTGEGTSKVGPMAQAVPRVIEKQSNFESGVTKEGVQITISLKSDPQRSCDVTLPQTWPEFLTISSKLLNTGEVTRVFSMDGVPILGLQDINAGDSLLIHSAAKGQFESWSYGLVVKRRYLLREKLGEGGLGVVWLAMDSITGFDVILNEEGDQNALVVRDAILMEKGVGAESDRRRLREERFLREISIVENLRDKHVCAALDHGLQQGRMFVVLEFLQGQSLSEALAAKAVQGEVLTVQQVHRLAIELLLGLEMAHENGLQHLNVNPANVFISSDGVKLLGLGLALWEPEMIRDSSLRLPTKAMPQYMSPEQISGHLTDQRSDIFSVGVLLFQCICGKLPFNGSGFVQIAESITQHQIADIKEFTSFPVSPDLNLCVLKALAKNPEQRYKTVREMREELERIDLEATAMM